MDVAIVFLPLIGAIIAGLFGRWVGDKGAMWTTCSLLGLSAVLSWILALGQQQSEPNRPREPVPLAEATKPPR